MFGPLHQSGYSGTRADDAGRFLPCFCVSFVSYISCVFWKSFYLNYFFKWEFDGNVSVLFLPDRWMEVKYM